jgi:Tfp pilus assembly protein PilF
VLFAASINAIAEEPWTEVSSPHFRVLTNGDTSDARHVAHEFEQMRFVFATEFPGFRLDSGAPLTIFAVRDEKTAKELDTSLKRRHADQVAGEFARHWDKQYALVRLDEQTGLESNDIVYHEYTHSILALNSHWLPDWLNEGLAEFYGYTQFEGNKIYIGGPTVRVRALQQVPIPIETLLTMSESQASKDNNKMEIFYAESWALVHYMNFGPDMNRGRKLDQFFSLIQQGMEQQKAFHQVFGDYAPLDRELGQYMRSLAFHAAVLHEPEQKVREKDYPAAKLTQAQTNAELAEFHLWNHDLLGAKTLAEQALKEDPNLGLAHEAEGFVHFTNGEDTAAVEEFTRAYSLDPTLYLSLFSKTMMSPVAQSSTSADEAVFHDAMFKVLEIDPQFGPAYIQLARLAVRENNLSLALGESRRAEELEPSRAGYHLMTGEILRRMGRNAAAAQDAEYVAGRWPPPDHDEAVELWGRIPASARPAGVSLTIYKPINVQIADGIVKSTTCDAGAKQPWTLVLEENGKDMAFHRKGPLGAGFSDTLWWGEDHFNICRHLTGLRAVVKYMPSADGSAGDVVAMGIRNDLPADKPATDRVAKK